MGVQEKGPVSGRARNSHCESPGAEASRHLLGVERSSVGWAGVSSERGRLEEETEGGASLGPRRAWKARTVACTVGSGCGLWEGPEGRSAV